MSQEKEKDVRRWDVDTYEAIDTETLEAIPFEYPGITTEVAYIYPEFTLSVPGQGCLISVN
jgi:7-cyano-7-deazaguanine reductase